MRWFCLVSVSLLAACGAAEVQSQKLADGSYKVTCELPMDDCIRRVQDQCKYQRFRILEGVSATRLRDAPPFESEYHSSRLHMICTDDGVEPLLSFDKPAAAPSAAPPSLVCAPGETRACVGSAACKGGQACLPTGKGFGPCDCGPAASPPVAPPPPAPVANPPADAVAPPAGSPVEQPNNPVK